MGVSTATQPRTGAGAPSATVQPGRQADPLAGHPKYRKLEDLSSGSFGFVQRCTTVGSPDDVVAIKFMERGDRVNRYVEAEILNHRMLRHPHVIEFREVFLTPDYICIAMEFASGGNLFNYVKRAGRLKEAAARWFFQQLIIGLDYCHRRGVVNRDIKLENTLLQLVPGLPLPLIKICDFGYSKAHFMSAPKSKVGTLAYMAPEVIRSTGNYNGDLADIWSCGVMLYVMLFGQYPFDASAAAVAVNMANGDSRENRVQQQMNRILSTQWTIPNNVGISAECRSLLSRLLVVDPAQRITMAQIQAEPWFRANLPANALGMNDNFLENTDYTGVQTVEEIQAILQQAQVPGPSRHNFNTEEEEFDLIEEAIQDDLVAHTSSFAVEGAVPHRPAAGPAYYLTAPARPATVTSAQYSSAQGFTRPAVVTSSATTQQPAGPAGSSAVGQVSMGGGQYSTAQSGAQRPIGGMGTSGYTVQHVHRPVAQQAVQQQQAGQQQQQQQAGQQQQQTGHTMGGGGGGGPPMNAGYHGIRGQQGGQQMGQQAGPSTSSSAAGGGGVGGGQSMNAARTMLVQGPDGTITQVLMTNGGGYALTPPLTGGGIQGMMTWTGGTTPGATAGMMRPPPPVQAPLHRGGGGAAGGTADGRTSPPQDFLAGRGSTALNMPDGAPLMFGLLPHPAPGAAGAAASGRSGGELFNGVLNLGGAVGGRASAASIGEQFGGADGTAGGTTLGVGGTRGNGGPAATLSMV